MVSEIFFVFHYKSMEANDPSGMASLDMPRGLIGRIYVGDH